MGAQLCKGFFAPNVPCYRLFSGIKNRNSFQAAVCQYAERDAIGLITPLLLGYSVVTCLPAVHKRDDLRLFACFLISPRLRELVFICLSGLATGASWLCYFKALQSGPASIIVPIDKLSILVTVTFSYFVFHEKLSGKSAFGLILITAGTLGMLV